MFSTLSNTEHIVMIATVQFGESETPSEGTIQSDGSTTSGNSQQSPSMFSNNFFTMLMLLLVGMIVFSMFGGRKQRKKRAAMLSSLHKRDQVLTRGGVFGSIVEIKEDRVVLKVDESSNTRITVLRDSIERVTAETTNP